MADAGRYYSQHLCLLQWQPHNFTEEIILIDFDHEVEVNMYYLSIAVNSITVANLLNRFPPIAIVRKTFPSI